MNLFKAPKSSNNKTGNVTLSYQEFETLSAGAYDHIISNGNSVPTDKFMVNNAKDMNGYMLVPTLRSSFLVKNI